jgi:hypothetical protein
MSSKGKKYRSAGSGKFISKEAADASPDTTVSEQVTSHGYMHAYEFLKLLARKGGTIVSSNDCTVEEITVAKAEKRFYVDADSFGYVYVPAEAAEETNEGQ